MQGLVECGDEIMNGSEKGGPTYSLVDGQLIEVTGRWHRLVPQLDARESVADRVLIAWRGYADMRHGVQAFITQMSRLVGSEPLESAGGDRSLLPTYKVREVLHARLEET